MGGKSVIVCVWSYVQRKPGHRNNAALHQLKKKGYDAMLAAHVP